MFSAYDQRMVHTRLHTSNSYLSANLNINPNPKCNSVPNPLPYGPTLVITQTSILTLDLNPTLF